MKVNLMFFRGAALLLACSSLTLAQTAAAPKNVELAETLLPYHGGQLMAAGTASSGDRGA